MGWKVANAGCLPALSLFAEPFLPPFPCFWVEILTMLQFPTRQLLPALGRAAALLLPLLAPLLAPLPALGQNAPRVSLHSLMNLDFKPNGIIFVSHAETLFLPPGTTPANMVLRKEGKLLQKLPMQAEPYYNAPAFGRAKPKASVFLEHKGAGTYTLSLELAGKEVGGFQYQVTETGGNDPFNPEKKLLYDGPWNKTVLLTRQVTNPTAPLGLFLFLPTRDLPGFAPNKQLPFRVELQKDGKEVAYFEGVATENQNLSFHQDLMQGVRGQKKAFTYEMLTAAPGNYEVVVKSGTAVARRHKFSVAGGKILQPAARELAHPGQDFLAPQTFFGERQTELFWLVP